MKTISRCGAMGAAVIVSVLLFASPAIGQFPTHTKGNATQARVSTQALPFDLVAEYQPPGGVVESWSETNPCTPHHHTYKSYIKVGRRSGPFPTPTATLYRDDQPIETWDLSVAPGNLTVTIGKFEWTWLHNCPGGGVTLSPAPPPNYRLVVDPGSKVTEHSESNNIALFYIDPAHSPSFVKLP